MRFLLYTLSSRDAIGGAERVRSMLADELRERGHTVTTVFTEPKTDLAEVTAGRWALRITGVETWRKLPTASSVFSAIGSLSRLARCLWVVRPDVVNVHYIDVRAAYFLALQPFFKYRVVLTAHGSDVLLPFNQVNRTALPHLLRRADSVVAVSEAVATGIRRVAPDMGSRVTVIENGIDNTFWSPLSAPPVSSPPRVIHVGRLSHVKGQDLLLDAFAQVLTDYPDARLELIGDGEQRGPLERQATSLGIADSVSFLGTLSPEAVLERLQGARVAVLPSRSEAFGLALLEAMSTGVPTVAASVGGVPRVAGTPPACLLVPPESPGALAEAIKRVLGDAELRGELRERGLQRAQDFSIGRHVEQTEAVLEQLMPEEGTTVR